MSAQTTIEVVKTEQAAVYVDVRGYAYCTYCHHDGIDYSAIRSLDVDGECDRCGRLGAESIEVVTGTALIGYPPCKVF